MAGKVRRAGDAPDEPDVPSVTRHTVTVNYLSAEDGSRLAESYTIRRSEGSRYDVSAQAAKTIAGFTIDRVEGETEGALKGDVTVNVYYTKDSGTTPAAIPRLPSLSRRPGREHRRRRRADRRPADSGPAGNPR